MNGFRNARRSGERGGAGALPAEQTIVGASGVAGGVFGSADRPPDQTGSRNLRRTPAGLLAIPSWRKSRCQRLRHRRPFTCHRPDRRFLLGCSAEQRQVSLSVQTPACGWWQIPQTPYAACSRCLSGVGCENVTSRSPARSIAAKPWPPNPSLHLADVSTIFAQRHKAGVEKQGFHGAAMNRLGKSASQRIRKRKSSHAAESTAFSGTTSKTHLNSNFLTAQGDRPGKGSSSETS